jgi:hypothetical protein
MIRYVVAAALAFALVTTTHAQPPGRLLPAGKLGELTGRQQPLPLVQIGSETLRLSPGALVFDQMNRTIVHAGFPDSASVLYGQASGGEISGMYLLRPDELGRLKRESKR